MSDHRVPDSARFEIKFAVTPLQRYALEAWIGRHPLGFFEPFPERQVNNIYFDTHDLKAFRENLSGASERSKVRLRWYGEVEEADSATLEVKRRRAGLGWKLSHRTGPLKLRDLPWPELRRNLRGKLTSEARLWLDANPQAVLINRYRRRYLESADRRLRVTFDWQQRVYDQRNRQGPHFLHGANLPESMVIEFKFAPEDRRLASQAIQGFPVRVSRNSKYVIGVLALRHG